MQVGGHGCGHGCGQQPGSPYAATAGAAYATTGAAAAPQLLQQTWKTLFQAAEDGPPLAARAASAQPHTIPCKGLMA